MIAKHFFFTVISDFTLTFQLAHVIELFQSTWRPTSGYKPSK